MKQFTPGPWYLVTGFVATDTENEICIAKADRDSTNPIRPTERDANMRLCSAAPDLFNACDAALTWWHSKPSNMYKKEPKWLETMREAIGKASNS